MTKKRIAWNKDKKLSKEHRDKVIKTLPKNQWGEKNLNWKGGRTKKGGYILIKNHDHPYRYKNNYYPEHRLVMEKHLGRILDQDEHVHHVNGVKSDNHIDNLVLISNEAHARSHRLQEVEDGEFHKIRPDFRNKKNIP